MKKIYNIEKFIIKMKIFKKKFFKINLYIEYIMYY